MPRVRWCTAEAPAPRPAYHSADEPYPGLRRRPWCRLYRLMAWRGLLDDDCAQRMAKYLADTDTVGADGVIRDVPAMLAAYMARCHVSKQTAYTDLARLVERGLVRQLQAAAPGIKARYRMSFPAAVVAARMPGLPRDLARELIPAPAATAHAAGHESASDQDQAGFACGELDTSPLTREGSPPSRCSTRQDAPAAVPPHRPGKISSEEKDRALSVLSACVGEWRAHRGAHGVPGPGELARLVPLAAVALRHVTPGEVTQLLTYHVASAKNLPGTLAWRLGRVIDGHRRPRHVPVDDDGARDAAWWARPGNSAHGDAAAILGQLRRRLGPARTSGHWRDPAALAAAQVAESHAAPSTAP